MVVSIILEKVGGLLTISHFIGVISPYFLSEGYTNQERTELLMCLYFNMCLCTCIIIPDKDKDKGSICCLVEQHHYSKEDYDFWKTGFFYLRAIFSQNCTNWRKM